MSPKAAEVLEQARQLTADEQHDLALQLLSALGLAEEDAEDDAAFEAAIAAGDAAIARGEGIPHEEAMRILTERLERIAPRPSSRS